MRFKGAVMRAGDLLHVALIYQSALGFCSDNQKADYISKQLYYLSLQRGQTIVQMVDSLLLKTHVIRLWKKCREMPPSRQGAFICLHKRHLIQKYMCIHLYKGYHVGNVAH
jgi:hypothetical protein